jgi:hypothetical protein
LLIKIFFQLSYANALNRQSFSASAITRSSSLRADFGLEHLSFMVAEKPPFEMHEDQLTIDFIAPRANSMPATCRFDV